MTALTAIRPSTPKPSVILSKPAAWPQRQPPEPGTPELDERLYGSFTACDQDGTAEVTEWECLLHGNH